MSETLRKNRLAALGLVIVATISWSAFADLEPPGPPSEPGTMQDQVFAADLPLDITAPGSYHLAENVVTAGGGITISVSNVSVDLMGFTLRGGTGDGIRALSGMRNITVANGTVSGWSGNGVNLQSASNIEVRGVKAEGNGSIGILSGQGSTVSNCAAAFNASDGFSIGAGSVISNSTASFNDSTGFVISGDGCSVSNCSAHVNGGSGFTFNGAGITGTGLSAVDSGGDGFNLGSDNTLIGSVAVANGDQAGEDGIAALNRCTIIDCRASFNAEDGIHVISGSYIARNACQANGQVDGAGIHATNADNRIEENHVLNNDRGLDVDLAGNTIFKNTASGNTDNYGSIVGGNDVGPIGTAAAATSPWANIAF